MLFLVKVTNKGEGRNCVGGLQPKNLKLKQRSVELPGRLSEMISYRPRYVA